MATETTWHPPQRNASHDIGLIAFGIARDRADFEDLRQEMWCELLTLPTGHPRRFYLAALRRLALRYWGRSIIDAPLDPSGKPALHRRTICVGGLRELDRLCRREAA